MNARTAFISVFLVIGAAVSCHASEFPLAIATRDYPHAYPIQNGAIHIPECRISYTTATLTELQRRWDTGSAGDVIEVDIVAYLQRFAQEEKHDWVLVPVFLWREFPQHHVSLGPDSKAVIHSTSPAMRTWGQGIIESSTSTVKLIFEDPRAAEQDYFRHTRIFPIITVLAVRRELIEANPWLSEALFIAFSDAKSQALEQGTIPLPWGEEHREETIALMKKNYWSYGVKNNPKTLNALFEYAHKFGGVSRAFKADDIFAPETLQLIDEKGTKN